MAQLKLIVILALSLMCLTVIMAGPRMLAARAQSNRFRATASINDYLSQQKPKQVETIPARENTKRLEELVDDVNMGRVTPQHTSHKKPVPPPLSSTSEEVIKTKPKINPIPQRQAQQVKSHGRFGFGRACVSDYLPRGDKFRVYESGHFAL